MVRMQWVLAAAAAAFLAAGAANAATLKFKAHLTGAQEVPPTKSAGSGDLTASLDTSSKAFTYKVTYKGLSGPATAAHFHGPAAPGANAPPVVMVANPASPISGSATLTDPQVADLKAGKWYFNVH